MISRFFIDRPIFACVLSAFIALAGLAALPALPVASYPDILPPQVEVYAFYPGASAEVIADTVAAPLEQQINGVDNMLYLSSASAASGFMSISVTFAVGTDVKRSANDVNTRIQAALPFLPEEVRRQGVIVRDRTNTFLQIVTIDSANPRYDQVFLSNYALINIVDELKRIPGVATVEMYGAKDYSIRIWLQPDRMAQLQLTPTDVAQAVREQNSQFATGRIGQEPVSRDADFTFTVTTQGRLTTPEEFGNIILRAREDGTVIRLRDVARVELGAREYEFVGKRNGRQTIPMGVFTTSDANALSVAAAVRLRMEELAARFPEGIEYSVPYDTTRFVEDSIREVVMTLGEAMLLVFAVVFLFLQNWRATLIPALAVPVSLIGALSGMYLFGFSINTLTLFGMVLSIGIVVDDAIVVLENVERLMRTEHLSPRAATMKAMEEVSGPVIAIVLVLAAVFLPVAFLGGLVGEMYRQFAITIAVSVTISGFVALTLTPALCALILKPEHKTRIRLLRAFEAWFARVTGRYTRGAAYMIRHGALAASLIGVMIIATIGLFRLVPGALAPDEDQGYVFAIPILQDAASLKRTEAVADELDRLTLAHPAVSNTVTFSGIDILTFSLRTNTGVSFASLKDWSERTTPELSAQALVQYLFQAGNSIRDAMVLAFNPPPIAGLSATGGFQGYVQSRLGTDYVALDAAARKLVEATRSRPELVGVATTFSASVPQMRLDLDRERTKLLGVSIDDVFTTLQSTFGALYVNDFNQFGRTFRVHVQAEPQFRTRPEDIRNVFVRSAGGELVPLGSLIQVRESAGPEIVERFNVFPAAKLLGGPAPGYSTGQAIAAMEELAKEVLPDGYALDWSGSAYQEKLTGGASTEIFLYGVIMVFLILSALYERFTLPLAVIMAVPFAVFGSLAAVWLRGLENDIYFQIGLVTLVGLAAKNAILIVEFAEQRRRQGMALAEAAVEAARLRFRPIVMTSLAFIFGATPLAISSGAGAASRHSIGTGVIGGMLAATFLATLFVPVCFQWVARLSRQRAAPPPEAAALLPD
jgi:HAE1 family hydrophobic/amphiphilic exporter-1/multidrug efflux pump